MTCFIDLSPEDDPQDAVHQIVECLVGGGIARLKSESADDLLALATHSQAAKRLHSLKTNQCSALMVSGAEAAADFVPGLPSSAARLFRRTHVPLHISFDDGVDDRLVQELSTEASQLVKSDGGLRFAIPVGRLMSDVLRLLPGPVAVMALEAAPAPDHLELEVQVGSQSQAGPPTVIQYHRDTWTVAEAGGLSEEDIARMIAEKIVFVCTGNTCRSPMAEGMFRKLLAERLGCSPETLAEHGFAVASAGVAAMMGAPASPESVEICASHGVDLRSHASQPLQLPLLESSDRLYTMTAGHRDAIRRQFPAFADRVSLLSRQGRDVTDPIGSGWSAYERCYDEITDNLQILVDDLTAPR